MPENKIILRVLVDEKTNQPISFHQANEAFSKGNDEQIIVNFRRQDIDNMLNFLVNFRRQDIDNMLNFLNLKNE